MSKVYQATGITEDERLEAIQILEDHGFIPDDVYRLEVDDDQITVYRYETPRRAEGDEAAVLPPVSVPL